jgi:hypothetical protein
MSDTCSCCGESFGYDTNWDDIPEGEGRIEVKFNPADEPSFVVEECRQYCSRECMNNDWDNHQLGGSETGGEADE